MRCEQEISNNKNSKVMTIMISNDKDLALVMAVATSGEKYLADNNGHIDLDDDDAVDAMVWQDIKNEIFF